MRKTVVCGPKSYFCNKDHKVIDLGDLCISLIAAKYKFSVSNNSKDIGDIGVDSRQIHNQEKNYMPLNYKYIKKRKCLT